MRAIAAATVDAFAFNEATVYLLEADKGVYRAYAPVGRYPEVDRQVLATPVPVEVFERLLSERFQVGRAYFIDHRDLFVARLEEIDEYITLQYGILEAILKAGAAVSHHHGIGKQTGPWFEEQIGQGWVDVTRVLRNHFDPNQIMNPGGTLALDMTEEQKEKRWGMSK